MEEVSTCPADERVTAISMTSEFIALGVPTGYKIFSLNPIKLIKYKDMGGEIGQIGLYRTDKIIWFVGSGDMPAAPINEFRLWDNDNDEQLGKIMLKSTIKTVIVKHNNVLISLIDSAGIYTLPFSEKDNVIFDTVDNPYGVIASAKDEDSTVAGFLSNEHLGELIVYDYDINSIRCKIPGDRKQEFFITCLALSTYGKILATTTSEGGTIHVYNAEDGKKLIDFSRGTLPVEFNYLSFQLDDTRLIVGSRFGTIHIFTIDSSINKDGKKILPK